MSRVLIFLTLFLGGSVPLWARPEISADFDPDKIRVGETARLNVKILWKISEGEYFFVLPEPELKNLKLVQQGEALESFEAGGIAWRQKTFTYIVEAVEKGQGLVSAMKIHYRNPDALLEGGSLVLSPQYLRIEETPGGLNKGLALFVLIFIPAAAGGGLLLKKYRRKSVPDEAASFADPVAEILEREGGRDLKAEVRALAAAYRRLLIRQYDLELVSAGDQELLDQLHQKKVDRAERAAHQRLLMQVSDAAYGGRESERELERLRDDLAREIRLRTQLVDQMTNTNLSRNRL